MNKQQIEYFLSAAVHLNFTKAADSFHTSQPTISRQIALLEEELGFELFIREKGNLRLSAGGAIMAQEFARSNKIIQDAISRVERVSEGLEGEMSIGYVSGTNTDLYVYPPSLNFMRKYPSIKVNMEAASFSGLRRNLEKGEFDVIYTLDFELPTFTDTLFQQCYAVSPIIAMSSAHPLAIKKDLTMRDFSGQTFLVPGPSVSPYGRLDVLRILDSLHVEDARLRDMDGNESLLFAVRSGIGVAILDTSLELVFDSRYSYFPLPPENEFNKLSIVTAWKRENLNPVIPLYMEVLKETMANRFTG